MSYPRRRSLVEWATSIADPQGNPYFRGSRRRGAPGNTARAGPDRAAGTVAVTRRVVEAIHEPDSLHAYT
jgi:hypothetical protein